METKAGILPKTLEDPIVTAGLEGISTLDNNPHSKGLYLIVGGIAVQSYLPIENRRPTSDIDLCIAKPLTYSEFKLFARPVETCLKDMGYDVKTEKTNSNYKLIISNPKDKDDLMIEFSRRNPQKFKEVRLRLERELEHGRRKIIRGTNTSYHVASPEDIALPKLVRGVGTLTRHPELAEDLKLVFSNDGNYDLKRILQYIIGERAIAQDSRDKEKLEKARLKADLYDSLSLSNFAGFNDEYLQQVINQWDKIKREGKERNFLFSLVNLRVN